MLRTMNPNKYVNIYLPIEFAMNDIPASESDSNDLLLLANIA